MRNLTLVAAVLLVVSTLDTACHSPSQPVSSSNLTFSVFLASQGRSQQLRTHAARRAKALITHEVAGPIYTVTATAYQAVAGQTDDEPFVTADNSFIKAGYSSKLRWLAISQDLLVHWGGKIKYGDRVRVRGVSPELDGFYTVHDTMNKRHRHCIDILSNPSEKFDIFAANVKLQRAVPVTAPRLLAQQTARPPAGTGNRAGRVKQRNRVAGRQTRRLVRPAERADYLASAIL